MRYLAIVCVLIITSCSDSQKVPKDIIQKEKMQAIMWDMIQADRYTNEFLPKVKDSLYDKNEILKVYQSVFNIHGITKDEFIKSYKFYLDHPGIAKVMFDSIANQAERKRAEIYIPKARKDSLRGLNLDTLGKTLILDSIKRKLRKE